MVLYHKTIDKLSFLVVQLVAKVTLITIVCTEWDSRHIRRRFLCYQILAARLGIGFLRYFCFILMICKTIYYYYYNFIGYEIR